MRENEQTILSLAMVPYVVYEFVSEPSEAKLFINGEYVCNTPTVPLIIRSTDVLEEGMVAEVTKDGYLTSRHVIFPDFDNRETVREVFTLTHVSKLNVNTDDRNLYLTVKTRKDETAPDSTLVNHLLLPADIYLPMRKTPYYVELRRGGTDEVAYRGSMKYDNEQIKGHYIQSWSQNYFQLLDFNFFLPINKQAFAVGEDQVPFRMLGNASLFKFKVVKGFSTAALHGSLFTQTNMQEPAKIRVRKSAEDPIVDAGAIGSLPALTFMFLNDELRVGGAVFDYMDVSLVGAYAWYPDFLKYVIPMNHFTGHDLFTGVELSSRLPFGDVKLKAGLQMYLNAKANIYSADLADPGAATVDKFYTQQLKMPPMFVLSVGVSLGGKDSKGENIFRIF